MPSAKDSMEARHSSGNKVHENRTKKGPDKGDRSVHDSNVIRRMLSAPGYDLSDSSKSNKFFNLPEHVHIEEGKERSVYVPQPLISENLNEINKQSKENNSSSESNKEQPTNKHPELMSYGEWLKATKSKYLSKTGNALQH